MVQKVRLDVPMRQNVAILQINNCTVLGVKMRHGHDHTSCATLGHLEMEF